MKKHVIWLVVIFVLLTAAVAGAAEQENLVRVNLGGLLIGPWTGTYGVDVAYERLLEDWLGWNLSVWGLNDLSVWGFGLGTSLDFFLIGDAPSGVFLNARTGAVFGEIYGAPSSAFQIGLSLGFQSVFPRGFVLRVGTGGSYIVGRRFVPRALVSVGIAF